MSTGANCQKCGTPVAAGALFCSRCGADVTAISAADAPTLEMPVAGAASPRVQATMRQTLRDATKGEYEVHDELGRGGMATVFLAQDIALDRKVAIKVIAAHLLEGEGMADRFKLEARTAAQLSHPHIIPIYAVQQTAETLFFVMKYVEGKALDEIIKRTGPLPIPMVRDVLGKVGSALGYAHRRDVIHRDVKPGNIMIDEEGTPIVTDFGIAKVAAKMGLTMTGTTIGTPAYMSPEQCEAKKVTGASDQYSLGVVAWEMLTGRTPFAGDSAVTTMYKHCHEPLPPLGDFRPDCPPDVIETVTRMLAKKPEERWPSLEAAVTKLGGATYSALEPIRSQLLELASQPEGRELIAHLHTPRTPIGGLAKTAARAGTAADALTRPAPAERKRRSPMIAAAIVVLIGGGGGALAVLRPWEGGAVGGRPEVGAPPSTAGTQPEGASSGGAADPPTAQPAVPDPGPAAGGSDPAPPNPTPSAPVSQPTGGGRGATPPQGNGSQPTRPPSPAPVASVRIDGVRSGLEPGDRLVLTATGMDERGGPAGVGAPRWSASDESVGQVSPDGTFTAIAAGSVAVTAQIDGVSARTTIEIAGPSVASVDVDRSTLSLTAGQRSTLVAGARDRNGAALSSPIGWRSSNAAVASVTERGEVTATAPGQATITATSGGASATVSVTVEAAPVDTRTAITELIAAYARALEGGDISAVRRAYPGMTTQQERDLTAALPNLERAILNVGSGIDEQGDVATVPVSGTYEFVFDGRRQQVPVSFTATFERAGPGWRMTRTQ